MDSVIRFCVVASILFELWILRLRHLVSIRPAIVLLFFSGRCASVAEGFGQVVDQLINDLRVCFFEVPGFAGVVLEVVKLIILRQFPCAGSRQGDGFPSTSVAVLASSCKGLLAGLIFRLIPETVWIIQSFHF